MKSIIKVAVFSVIIIFSALSLSSCDKNNGYISQEVPIPNKNVFNATGTTRTDTLYMKYTPDFYIRDISVKKGNTGVGHVRTQPGATEIKDGNKVIGHIEYKDGEVYKISMDGWCTILKDESGKHKKAYLIKGEGAASYPYIVELWFWGKESPAYVTIK